MSIEFYVALDKGRFPGPSSLNDAAREMGIPIEVSPHFADLSRNGYQPVQYAGLQSGVEAGLAPLENIRGEYEMFDSGAGDRHDSVITLTFGSNAREGAVAMGICAVLNRVADAQTYSTDDGRFVEEAELITWMHDLEQMATEHEAPR